MVAVAAAVTTITSSGSCSSFAAVVAVVSATAAVVTAVADAWDSNSFFVYESSRLTPARFVFLAHQKRGYHKWIASLFLLFPFFQILMKLGFFTKV